MADPCREEVLNVILAEILRDRGFDAVAEIRTTSASGATRLPDIKIKYRGLVIWVECKIGDERAAGKDAAGRVEEGLCRMSVALVYPDYLPRVKASRLKSELAIADLRIRTFSETGPGSWNTGNIQTLDELLRRTYERLVEEDVVKTAIGILNKGINTVAKEIANIPTGPERLVRLLQIGEAATTPSDEERRAATRIAALMLANAFIFQEELSAFERSVKPLSTLGKGSISGKIIDHWQYIIDNINYIPIFKIAIEILQNLPSHIDTAIRAIIECAKDITALRAALRHDLMGRIYHRLLVEAKFLGTYYTSVPAATILLKLALSPDSWPLDWTDPESLTEFRIADLACGTGTLLMAADQAVIDNHAQACFEAAIDPDVNELHKNMIENTIWGFDVVASAVHLTASTLALLSPQVSFNKMHLYCLPLGGDQHRMGSIDFLSPKADVSSLYKGGIRLPVQADLFGDTLQAAKKISESGSEETVVDVPPLSLCVMNPPFTRSVGDNLLFGSLPESERKDLQKELAKLLRRPGVLAQSVAGLASVFVAVGDRLLQESGRIALVLPNAILSGVAWGETRALLMKNYSIEAIVTSSDPQRWNFSENTSLSEALIVARKREGGRRDGEDASKIDSTLWVNLWDNPTTGIEAIGVFDAIDRKRQANEVPNITGSGVCQLQKNGSAWGEIFLTDQSLYCNEFWWPYAFAQTDLVRVLGSLLGGELAMPGTNAINSIQVTRLKDLGDLGPDRRDVYDGFEKTSSITSYPAFWGHEAKSVSAIGQSPNSYLAPLSSARAGRSLRRIDLIWPRAGQLLIAESLRLNTQRLAAVYVDKAVLSNVWWPFKLKEQTKDADADSKILALWLASTLGLIILIGHREATEGSWIGLKKPMLSEMPVLDPSKLNKRQRKSILDCFDLVAKVQWGRIGDMTTDANRKSVDLAFSEALGLPDVSPLREALAREPIISGTKIGA